MNITFKFHLFYRTEGGKWEYASSFTHQDTAMARITELQKLGLGKLKVYIGEGPSDEVIKRLPA